MLKVMHVLNSRQYSGAENVAITIIKSMREQVYSVYVSPNGSIRDYLAKNNIVYFPLGKLSFSELQRAIKEIKPDIVHAHDFRAIILATLVCKREKVIAHIHTSELRTHIFSLKAFFLAIASIRIKHIFWVSKAAYNSFIFRAIISRKSSVLQNVVDLNKLRTMVKEDKNIYNYDIVFVGRITAPKNPLRLIDVYSDIIVRKSQIKIAIVGDGDLTEKTIEKIKTLGLNDNIGYLGRMSNPYKLMSEAKVMIMTSLWEGLPMVALECLGLGIPVVSTPVDGMLDIITNDYNGYLCNCNVEIVDKTQLILENVDLQQRLSKNALSFSEKYNDLNGYMQKIMRIYFD